MEDSGRRSAGRIEFIRIKVDTQKGRFDLADVILKAVEDNGERIEDGDILAVSSKFVAMSEARFIDLKTVHPSVDARRLASIFRMKSRVAELVLREAEAIFGGVKGFVLAIKDGVLAPNAGIDKSNIFPGHVILYPEDSFQRAEDLRRQIKRRTGKKVGVVLTDSRLLPTRIGTVGVTVAVSGFEPVKDERGRSDLFGNTLKVTRRAIADDISSGAQLLMGEADEGVPVVIIRQISLAESPIAYTERRVGRGEFIIDYRQCIYIRGLTRRGYKPPLRRRVKTLPR